MTSWHIIYAYPHVNDSKVANAQLKNKRDSLRARIAIKYWLTMRISKRLEAFTSCAIHTKVDERALLCVYKFIHSGGRFRKYTFTEIVYVIYVWRGP